MGIAKKMLQELQERFKHTTDPTSDNFESLLVTTTFLNPAYRDILTDTQTGAAKDYLLGLCKPPIEDSDCTYVPEELAADDNSNNEPPSRHPKLLSRVTLLLEEKRKEKQSASFLDLPTEQKEIQKYRFNEDTNDDPLNFWKGAANYPIIGPIACDILCVPASTAPAERVFSTSGESTLGKRNRLTDYNLDREVLLRRNKLYLRIYVIVLTQCYYFNRLKW